MQSRDLSADLDMNREVLNIHVGTVLHESKAVLRERPDSNSLEVGRLPKGSKIKIIGKYKNFFHVYQVAVPDRNRTFLSLLPQAFQRTDTI